MSRKKCKACKGVGKVHLDLAGPFDCSCGNPDCTVCRGTGERQRHKGTDEDLEKAKPGYYLKLRAEDIAQDVDRLIVEEMIEGE